MNSMESLEDEPSSYELAGDTHRVSAVIVANVDIAFTVWQSVLPLSVVLTMYQDTFADVGDKGSTVIFSGPAISN